LYAEWRRFDVVHAHNTFLPLNWLAATVAGRGCRVFFHAHGALDPLLLSGWGRKSLKKRLYVALVERRNFNAARGVIGLTESECAQIVQTRTRAAIFELGNGISIRPGVRDSAAAAFRLRHHVPHGAPVFLFVGRITPKKGLHFLLEAMPAVLARHPDVVLVIGGNRSEESGYTRELDGAIRAAGFGERVRWVGFLDEAGKDEALAAAALFVHPSFSEGMAMAILEAMAAGVPTVVTPGCYMDAAVAAGALCETRQSPAEIAAALIALLDDPAGTKRLGRAGENYVREHHAWSTVAARLELIYRADPHVRPYRQALT
jgi:glycosyltransferase involved in cell wall biosynthesis